MAKAPQPSVKVEDQRPNETTLRVTNGIDTQSGHQGTLIMMRTLDDGTLHITPYRSDDKVIVSVSVSDIDCDSDYLRALALITRQMLDHRDHDPHSKASGYLAAVAVFVDRYNAA